MRKIFEPESIVADLPGIIILSHGPLAGSLIESMKLICGEAENVAAFELHEGDDPDEFCEAFSEAYRRMPEGTVFLVDLFGGSPFNQVTLYALKNEMLPRAVTGVNLGMLLEAVNLRSDQGEDFYEKLEQAGRDAVVDIAKAMGSR